ncbi:hypothetical protein [Helicobacter cetorum]|uniref:hypothetical protein n=1 Tax=Helicobacter cetorum TaxID=138563 RepID=UPI0013157633|nr:hypothetical protein [Helicobacter cetorum]
MALLNSGLYAQESINAKVDSKIDSNFEKTLESLGHISVREGGTVSGVTYYCSHDCFAKVNITQEAGGTTSTSTWDKGAYKQFSNPFAYGGGDLSISLTQPKGSNIYFLSSGSIIFLNESPNSTVTDTFEANGFTLKNGTFQVGLKGAEGGTTVNFKGYDTSDSPSSVMGIGQDKTEKIVVEDKSTLNFNVSRITATNTTFSTTIGSNINFNGKSDGKHDEHVDTKNSTFNSGNYNFNLNGQVNFESTTFNKGSKLNFNTSNPSQAATTAQVPASEQPKQNVANITFTGLNNLNDVLTGSTPSTQANPTQVALSNTNAYFDSKGSVNVGGTSKTLNPIFDINQTLGSKVLYNIIHTTGKISYDDAFSSALWDLIEYNNHKAENESYSNLSKNTNDKEYDVVVSDGSGGYDVYQENFGDNTLSVELIATSKEAQTIYNTDKTNANALPSLANDTMTPFASYKDNTNANVQSKYNTLNSLVNKMDAEKQAVTDALSNMNQALNDKPFNYANYEKAKQAYEKAYATANSGDNSLQTLQAQYAKDKLALQDAVAKDGVQTANTTINGDGTSANPGLVKPAQKDETPQSLPTGVSGSNITAADNKLKQLAQDIKNL